MNIETREKRPLLKARGKRYTSVEEMMKGEGVPSDSRKRISKRAAQSRVSTMLAEIRTAAGVTQAQLAREIGCTQGCISKWECESDDELTLKTIAAYSRFFKKGVNLSFGRPLNRVETIKMHALELKHALMDLAELAKNGDDDGIEKGIKAFFGEAFFNLLDILEICQKPLLEEKATAKKEEKFEIRMAVQSSSSAPTRTCSQEAPAATMTQDS